jgi:hypothetical protein
LFALRSLHEETLDIRITLIVSIIEYATPDLLWLVFLYQLDVVLKVYVGVEARQLVVAVLQNDQDAVTVEELTQQASVLVVVQTVDVWIVPYLATT